MASVVVRVADAVLDVVQSLDLGEAFECERTYADWDDELATRDKMRVDVIPLPTPTVEHETRGSIRYLVEVGVYLRKRLRGPTRAMQDGTLDVEELDRLAEAVEQIAEACVPDRFDSLEPLDVVWVDTTIPTLFNRDHLRQYGQFTGFVKVRFNASKVLP